MPKDGLWCLGNCLDKRERIGKAGIWMWNAFLSHNLPSWSKKHASKEDSIGKMFPHITYNPAILGGKPCIKGTRISVEFVLELLASGASRDKIVQAYPYLTPEDVEQALLYAARFLKNEVVLTAEVRS